MPCERAPPAPAPASALKESAANPDKNHLPSEGRGSDPLPRATAALTPPRPSCPQTFGCSFPFPCPSRVIPWESKPRVLMEPWSAPGRVGKAAAVSSVGSPARPLPWQIQELQVPKPPAPSGAHPPRGPAPHRGGSPGAGCRLCGVLPPVPAGGGPSTTTTFPAFPSDPAEPAYAECLCAWFCIWREGAPSCSFFLPPKLSFKKNQVLFFLSVVPIATDNLYFGGWEPQVLGQKLIFPFPLKQNPHAGGSPGEAKGSSQPYSLRRDGKSLSPQHPWGYPSAEGSGGLPPPQASPFRPQRRFPCPGPRSRFGAPTAATRRPLFLCLCPERICGKLERPGCLVAGVFVGRVVAFFFFF